jgi:aldehyde:ferredoxin oxidoreductase
MELFDRGVISKADLDGLELKVGNETAIMEMLGKIANRQGIGDVLAEGSVEAARRIGKGAEKYLHTIKGMEVMTADPRQLPTDKILGYIVCPRGGDDLYNTHAFPSGYPYWAPELGWSKEDYLNWRINFLDMTDQEKKEIFGSPITVDALQPRRIEGRAAMVKWHEQVTTITNSLGLCIFATEVWCAIGPTLCAKLYSACTGREVSPEELKKTGDRIFNLMKAYIVREGWTRKDDDWPGLFYEEPFPGEMGKGALLSRDEVNRLLDDYYAIRGWDKKTGIPTKKTLTDLGLDNVADELLKLGKIRS